MEILVVSQYFYPEQFRINDICREMVRRGHEVTVFTGLPNYPTGEIFSGYENKYNEIENIDGIRVIRCKLRPRHKGTKNLVLNYLSFVWNATRKISVLKNEYDVIYVYGLSPITSAIPAICFRKKFNIPVFYYCCDLWPESVLGEHHEVKNVGRNNVIFLVAKLISEYVYQNVNIIGCKCEEFIDYIHSVCNIDKSKMLVLYEHAEDSYLKVNATPEDNGIIDFMFLGNIGTGQNCDQIVKAASKLIPNRPFKVHFVGDGSVLQDIKRLVKELNMDDIVVFHGKHPVTKINKFYNIADVCLLTLANNNATGLTPPAKLTGYMAAARPVIGSINGAAKTIVEDAHCGLMVSAGDTEGLRELMQQAIDGKFNLEQYGYNGRSYFINHFTLKKHIDELEKCLYQLCLK